MRVDGQCRTQCATGGLVAAARRIHLMRSSRSPLLRSKTLRPPGGRVSLRTGSGRRLQSDSQPGPGRAGPTKEHLRLIRCLFLSRA